MPSKYSFLFFSSFIIVVFFSFAWGWLSHKHKLFPYYLLISIKNNVTHIISHKTPNPLPTKRIMIGDSLTECFQLNKFFPGTSIANYGVSGNTTKDVIHRLDAIIATQPTHALLMIGINDILLGKPYADIIKNYIFILETLQANKIVPTIQSTLYVANDYPDTPLNHDSPASDSAYTKSEEINILVKKLNTDLADYANKNKLVFINLNEVLAIAAKDETLRCAVSFDGLHLNENGYQRWKAAISPYISE